MSVLTKNNGTKFPSVFSDFFETDKLFPSDWFNKDWSEWIPSANVTENGNEYKVELAIPGMKKDEIHVNVEDDMLTITGEHKEEKEEKEKDKFTRKEFHYGSFSRAFRLPSAIKQDQIEAKFEDGLLRLCIPKSEEAKEKPKKEIKVG
jgi:HSP20 family protein